ncbi:MAG: D-2-hydroxyacid dehydrogenase [Lachnospiraceae bacterium]|nr:D-2-hydroxyacid dehydrogenase [Lachnospiraceae bacterium]
MKIVMLDTDSIGYDVDLSAFDELGEVVSYGTTAYDEIGERSKDADIIIMNKQLINEGSIKDAENLKLVCITATGINNLDTEYLDRRGIAWRNVSGYSTESVAQHTFAMMFYLLEQLPYYDNYTKTGKYVNDVSFTHFAKIFHELQGMTWGIIGMGNIGKRVAQIAECFGCKVIYYSTSGKNLDAGYECVSFDELLERSDIVSVHAPLNSNTEGLMNADAFKKMKNSAIFINVGRGPIVVEEDLACALENGDIKAAGIDVLCKEPMAEDCPLRRIQDSGKLIITPHIAWAASETRARLMDMVLDNIKNWQAGLS